MYSKKSVPEIVQCPKSIGHLRQVGELANQGGGRRPSVSGKRPMKTATLPSLTVCQHCNQYPSFLFAPAGPGRRAGAGTRTRGRVGCFFLEFVYQ